MTELFDRNFSMCYYFNSFLGDCL